MDRRESKRKPRGEGPGPGGAQARRPCRRRMTCPTPREISQAMASAGLGELPQACSLDQLLEQCLDAFDLDGRLRRGEYTVDMTLTVHSWVVPSAELARRLLAIYQEASRAGQEERALRVCLFVRHWVTHYPEAFRLEPALEEAVGELRRAALHEGREGHGRLLDTRPAVCGRLSPPRPRRPGAPGGSPKRKLSLLFDHLDAAELAEHLSCLEHRAFCRLSGQDCRRYVQRGGAQGSPALERAVALCNGVCQWVQLMVLSRPTAPQRAEVVAKLTRLTQALGAMAELVSARGNFGAYRRAFGACRGFRLPLLAVHLKDLAALDAALPGRLPGGRLNLPKLHGLYQHALDLRALQRLAPPFRADPHLLRLLALSLDLFYTEEELYELSHAREPRCPRALPPAPGKAPAESAWAPATPPRPAAGHHVPQTLESVFPPPDAERRGHVSGDDLAKAAAEQDGEGPFPHPEAASCPARADANAAFAKLGRSHDFRQATFKKPTFCQACNGFLWGVSKQGYRCRGCGTSCHKQCRELAEAECRSRFPAGGPPAPHPSSGDSEDEEEEEEEEGEEEVFAEGGSPRAARRDAGTQTEPPAPAGTAALLAQLAQLREERDRLLEENRRLRPAAGGAAGGAAALPPLLGALRLQPGPGAPPE
ncbi:RAS guanyl-releasing protein 4 isoform X2 [Dromaius novaehollandiae]|uniref:RAS guanyl-releasing protein 4 isoform X2 n=1 Tax=Dromaius novaehollandiae TaxID=8790 RepID=UPI00311E06B1